MTDEPVDQEQEEKEQEPEWGSWIVAWLDREFEGAPWTWDAKKKVWYGGKKGADPDPVYSWVRTYNAALLAYEAVSMHVFILHAGYVESSTNGRQNIAGIKDAPHRRAELAFYPASDMASKLHNERPRGLAITSSHSPE